MQATHAPETPITAHTTADEHVSRRPHPTLRQSFIDHIRATGLTRSYGDRRVLSELSIVVPAGARIGLIGENGVGKSTLLRILGGIEEPDSGTAAMPRRVGLLHQEVPLDDAHTIADVLERELVDIRAIERELDEAAEGLASTGAGLVEGGAAERYESALAQAERAEIWSVDARRDAILDGLRVLHLGLDRELSTISGGERSRVALAALLLGRPDALLLDEPTNHLDDSAVSFLTSQVRGWSGPVLFASHDRAFLDAVATGLADLDPSIDRRGEWRTRVTEFGGGYSDYLGAKAREAARWEAQYEAEQDELARLRESVDVTSRTINHNRAMKDKNKMSFGNVTNRVEGQVSRKIRSAKSRLEALEAQQITKPVAPLVFSGLPTGFSTSADVGPLLAAHGLGVGDRLRIESFSLDADARVLVTGHNGAGKSTLLSALAGSLRPTEGSVTRRRGVRVALLEQDVRFAEPESTPRQQYERAVGERRAQSLPLSSLGLLSARDIDRPVGVLSVGQRRRLALALIVAKPPHVFLLDEPTNHLSLALATELEHALGAYPGAVVIASHDRWLRDRWTDDRLHLDHGLVTPSV